MIILLAHKECQLFCACKVKYLTIQIDIIQNSKFTVNAFYTALFD